MATNIKYTNEMGSVITAQQQSALMTYSNITYTDNKLKKIEDFGLGRNKDFTRSTYFMDFAELKSDVLQSYANNKTICILLFNSQSQNNFIQWDIEGYSPSGVLQYTGIRVYDNSNRIIMSCLVDPDTRLALNGGIKNSYANKYPNEFDDRLLQFTYDGNGNLEFIADFNNTFGFNAHSITLEDFLSDIELSQTDFLWDQHTYFHALTPYLPDSTEI